MQSIRLVATLLAFLLPQASLAAVLGPKVELPLEWVWNRGSYGGNYYKATAFGSFAAASNGTDFLVVWTQGTRTGVVGPNGEAPWQTTRGVFAVRMNSAGAILDAAPLLLSTEWSPGPTLAHAGEWLAYAEASDSYLAAFGCENETEVCAVRVSSSGALLDATPIRLPSGATPIVSSDGVRHFVLAGNQMFVVAADGTWTAFPIGFSPGAVASDGLNLLNVNGADITLSGPDGATLASASMPAGIAGRSVTFDGNAYVILGYGPGAEGDGEYLTRVDTGGTVLDTSLRLRQGWADNFFDLSFDGLNDVAVWCPTPPAYDGGPVTIALLQSGAPVAEAEFLTTGKVLLRLSAASNALGTSAIAVDGFAYGESYNSFHPAVQLVTSWAPVTVSKSGTGHGTVVSTPAGIDCGSTCTGRFEVPATVTLTASADAGSTFEGWSGDCAGTDPVCTVAVGAAASAVATFAESAPPTLTVPDTIRVVATTAHGTAVEFAVSAHDGNGNALTAVCAPASGSIFPPGTTRVDCTATDAANIGASASFDVVVTFAWSGVLRPISADGSSLFKLGRTVPVKFQLAGASAGIPDLIASLSVAKISDQIQGSAEETVWNVASDDGNLFRFDPVSANYIFNLATGALSSGTWLLRFDFGDGVNRTVSFSLRP